MKTRLFKGLFCVFAVILCLVCSASVICFDNSAVLNNYLGISTGKIVNKDGSAGEVFYASAYGDGSFSDENLELLVADTYNQNVIEAQEGSVLLTNDGALPLSDNERTVDLFGQYIESAYHSGDGEYNVELKAALETNGFKVGSSGAEIAIVMFSRSAGEGNELAMKDANGRSTLALKDAERRILTDIKGKYKKIVVLLNSSNPMETEWLFEKSLAVNACLWIGGPGLRGFLGVVDILTGNANPSGRITDTYAADSTSAPACVGGSINSPRWNNTDYLKTRTSERLSSVSYYSVQAENIYIGYKYYETRYEDCVLKRYGANSSVGSFTQGAWNYADEVTFPFGYGLSYTLFEQKLESVEETDDGYKITVTVKNIGAAAGKCVVQAYAQTPYGDYERQNLVEKAAVNLVGFSKTKILSPKEEQTLTLSIDRYLLACYDSHFARGYIMSEGDYYLAIGDNAHDALNNILAAKGGEGMSDHTGEAVRGQADKVYSWREHERDSETYSVSQTGFEVTNRFEDCDINYWIEDAVTYLTRSDWAGTYPRAVSLSITDEMIEVINGDTYVMPSDAPDYNSFEVGVDKGINAYDMVGVDYDNPKWDDFISQLSLNELTSLLAGAFSKEQINSIVLPAYFSGDGIDGLSANFKTSNSSLGFDSKCMRYCDEVVLASTFNSELYINRGRLMGEEMLFCGFYTLYGPGGNLHRTPFGGRNCEYASEDANLTYIFNAEFMRGIREKGVVAQVKHLAGNDQEYNRAGIALFFTEQSWREGALRGFEGAFTKGGAAACMNGLNRIGLKWTNASKALCTDVLRGEWGLKGTVGSDGISMNYQTHFTTTVAAGTDSYCLDNKGTSAASIGAYLKSTKDGYMLLKVREAAKHNLYPLVNSNVMNGLSRDSVIDRVTPWWKVLSIVIIVVTAVITLAAGALHAFCEIKKRGKKQ